jgi:hypothetical protein
MDIPNVLGIALHFATDAPHVRPAPDAPANAKRPPAARTAKPKAARKPVQPTPVPTPAESIPGMSRAHAVLYMAAARGIMPTPPDFSKPSYACDRGRLAELVAMGSQYWPLQPSS